MNERRRRAFEDEWAKARSALRSGDLRQSFAHLERAHVLGQRSTRLHVRSHLAMLQVGWRRRDVREVTGQLFRIVAAALLSRVWVPEGNTGGADVSAMKPMPWPEDLRHLKDYPVAGDESA